MQNSQRVVQGATVHFQAQSVTELKSVPTGIRLGLLKQERFVNKHAESKPVFSRRSDDFAPERTCHTYRPDGTGFPDA